VNSAEPWVRGSTPTSETIGRTVFTSRPSMRKTVKQERYAAVDAVKAKVMAALAPAEGEARFEAGAEPWVRGSTPTSETIGRTVFTSRPSMREPVSRMATLGTGDDEQFIDALSGTYKETFLLHYNFPPYSVGRTSRSTR
jgi:polyribonucleotide nucleotidyltransferase